MFLTGAVAFRISEPPQTHQGIPQTDQGTTWTHQDITQNAILNAVIRTCHSPDVSDRGHGLVLTQSQPVRNHLSDTEHL